MKSLPIAFRAMCLAVLVAPLPGHLQAQGSIDFFEEWKWVDFSVEDLPDGPVEQMVEVGGVEWLRTANAVAFYDHFEWIELGPSRGFPEGESITSLSADGEGGILVVVDGEVFQGDSTGMISVTPAGSVPGMRIQQAFPNPGGGLFLTASQETADGGNAFLWRGGRIEEIHPRVRLTQGGTQVWRTRSGRIWAHTSSGLARWTGSALVVVDDPLPEYQEVTHLFENSHGRGFAFRERPFPQKGLLWWDGDSRPALWESEGKNDLQSGEVLEDGSAIAIWETGHFRRFENGRWSSVNLPTQRSQGLYFLHASMDGDLWFASSLGLHWFRSSSLNRWGNFAAPFPDPRNRINTLLSLPDGSVWAGSEVGVTHYVPDGGYQRFETMGSYARPVITDLARDSAGGIWVVSGGSFPGAFRWDGESWDHWGEEQGLDSGRIHSVEVDGSGGVWFLSLGGEGGRPGAYRLVGDVITRWLDPWNALDTATYAFAEGQDGAFWFGSRLGLLRFHDEIWEYWGREEGIGGGQAPWVGDIVLDTVGLPWFTHGPEYSSGLGTITREGDVRYLKQADGLPSDRLNAIERDAKGNLWVTSAAGVAVFREGVWAVFDGRHGLASPSIWPMAWTEDEILFGTLGGGLWALSREEESSPPPRIAVFPTLVESGVAYSGWGVYAFKGEVPADQALSRYRVDDGQWSGWTTEHTRVLRDLSPGNHTIQVQARGLFGQFDHEGETATFRIPYPLYLQLPFVVPVGFLSSVLLWVFIAYAARKRRHEGALKESGERFRTLVEAAPEAIAIYDVDAGRFIEANSNCGRLLGREKQEILARHPLSMSPEVQAEGRPSQEAATELLRRTLNGENPVSRWDVIREDGTVVPCELSLVPLPSKERRLVRFSLVDISERLKAEERERELEASLFQSQKLEAVGQLTGGVAHDFNNLLTVVLGNLELLREDLPPESALLESVTEARSAADRGAVLTQRLLAFSRKQTLEPRRIDVEELIPGLLQILRRTIGEDITIETVLPGNPWVVMADPAQLESAILNLAINARDAMPAGGRLIIEAMNIRLDEKSEEEGLEAGDYLVVAVSDSGSGMPPEVVTKAFDPFFTTKEVGKGSGLGLSMVYGFAVQSGGTARIYSEEGEGTTIRLYFPRATEGGEDPYRRR